HHYQFEDKLMNPSWATKDVIKEQTNRDFDKLSVLAENLGLAQSAEIGYLMAYWHNHRRRGRVAVGVYSWSGVGAGAHFALGRANCVHLQPGGGAAPFGACPAGRVAGRVLRCPAYSACGDRHIRGGACGELASLRPAGSGRLLSPVHGFYHLAEPGGCSGGVAGDGGEFPEGTSGGRRCRFPAQPACQQGHGGGGGSH